MKKMKQIFFAAAFAAVAGLAAGLTSCAEGYGPIGGGSGSGAQGEPITFDIGFEGQAGDGSSQATGGEGPQNSSEGPLTRVVTDAAFKSTWENGDKIGLFGYDANKGIMIKNVPLTYNATTQKWGGSVVYWPKGMGSLRFFAYYPYDARYDSATNAGSIQNELSYRTAGTDQSTAALYKSSDMLYSQPTLYNLGATVALTFRHSNCSMIQLTVNDAGEILDAARTTVTLRNVKINGYAGTLGDVKMYRFSTDPLVFRAVVPGPQTIEAGTNMFIISDGETTLNSSATTAAIDITALYVTRFTQSTPVIPKYAVGDPYPDADNAIGVVFEIEPGGEHGKIVSLDEGLRISWGPSIRTDASSMDDGLSNMAAVNQTSPGIAGFPAFEWVNQKNLDAGITSTYVSGTKGVWYLPAANELMSFYNAWGGSSFGDREIFEEYFNAVGASGPDIWLLPAYWSSTAVEGGSSFFDAYILNFSSGNLDNLEFPRDVAESPYSFMPAAVRAIMAF
ncbi:MAG: fimbrillin family protein [Alistipes sp.]|jgi:hypothetical protein|nr:fimbrillin family protein [Alistipes sp.]